MRARAAVAVAALVLLVYPVVSDDLYYQNLIILSLVFAIGAVGLNIISGYGGYISLGQGAFVGLGAYTMAILSTRIEGASPWVWVPVGGVVAAVFAALLGVIALRTRGHSFVIITIAFLFLLQLVAINWPDFTNGTAGLTLPLPMWSIDIQNWPFYYTLLALLAASLLLSWWIRRTKFGMGLVAMREDEDKAATVGVDTPVYKLLGFVASAVFVGMAGAVYGYYLAFVDPLGMFNILLSVQILLSMLIGGRGTLWGPVLGAFLIEGLNEFANNELGGGNARLLVFGGLMALVVLFLPRGILPSIAERLEARRTRGRAGLVGARLELRDRPERVEPPPVGPPLLEVRGLEKRFGGLRAVDGCGFSVPEGSITALIGPNGSGKTTVFNLIGGTMAADAGEVWFEGERIDQLPAAKIVARGIAMVPEGRHVYPFMSVKDNLLMGAYLRSDKAGIRSDLDKIFTRFPRVKERMNQQAGTLSGGEQEMVVVGRALMARPRLLLLDEPSLGLAPMVVRDIARLVTEVNQEEKVSVILVEQNSRMALKVSQYAYVLETGKIGLEGPSVDLMHNDHIKKLYLGG
jgi:ABC-type branched-subunit amino acid transport system ATPase component/ABC-type branched-subunit amino acid transport system permease subunit